MEHTAVVERVGAMEVDSEVEWHRLRIIIGVPDVACCIEVDQSADSKPSISRAVEVAVRP